CSFAAGVKFFPGRDIPELSCFDQFKRAVVRRFIAEHSLDEGVFRAERVAKIGQRIAERQQFDIVVNRFGGKKFKLERFAVAVTKLLEAFVVRLGALLRGAYEQALVLEERAVKRARLAINPKLRTFLFEITVD